MFVWFKLWVGSRFSETCQVSPVFYKYRCVEMISQQTKSIGFRDLEGIPPPKFREVSIVPLLKEDILMVVATIVDVVDHAGLKRHWLRPDRF